LYLFLLSVVSQIVLVLVVGSVLIKKRRIKVSKIILYYIILYYIIHK
jgi:hypothetical protein